MKPARVTHSLGRDEQGRALMLIQAGKVFVLKVQASKSSPEFSVQLTPEQIREMAIAAADA